MLAAVWNKGEVKLKAHTNGSLCRTPLPLKKKNILLRGGWTQANELRNGHEDIRYFHIPIIHLSLPPKSVAKALFPISLGIDNPPERTWKQYLCKILGVNKVYNG